MFAKIFVPALCISGLALGFCIGGVRAEPYGGAAKGGVSRAEPPLAPRYCKFVVQGKKADYRGSAVIPEAGVGTISTIAAE